LTAAACMRHGRADGGGDCGLRVIFRGEKTWSKLGIQTYAYAPLPAGGRAEKKSRAAKKQGKASKKKVMHRLPRCEGRRREGSTRQGRALDNSAAGAISYKCKRCAHRGRESLSLGYCEGWRLYLLPCADGRGPERCGRARSDTPHLAVPLEAHRGRHSCETST
jgi:DNA-directed RNA polymerase subunit M/transcription elongation factor TFIIS